MAAKRKSLGKHESNGKGNGPKSKKISKKSKLKRRPSQKGPIQRNVPGTGSG